MNKESIGALIKEIVGIKSVKIDEPMKQHTSFKIGGPADILVTPNNTDELCKVITLCRSEGIPFLAIGNGTNLIVRDKGIRGIVIKIFDKFNNYIFKEDTIESESGILLSKISIAAMENGLSGLEFASGIPGTLGGAVTMNAGAYGGEMKDIVVKTQYIDLDGNIKEVVGEDHKFGYRSSFLQKAGGIILKATLQLKRGNKSEIKTLMDDLNSRRKDKQPLEMPSAGSVFKRPEGYYTGKLVEDCGLKGYRIGGAEVSRKHCGFIVNSEDATASDITNLIKHVQDTVKLKFGVELQTEVKVIGEE